jgi:hypothetical protein
MCRDAVEAVGRPAAVDMWHPSPIVPTSTKWSIHTEPSPGLDWSDLQTPGISFCRPFGGKRTASNAMACPLLVARWTALRQPASAAQNRRPPLLEQVIGSATEDSVLERLVDGRQAM